MLSLTWALSILCLLGPARAQAVDADPVLVTVNGRTIRRAEVAELLWQRHAGSRPATSAAAALTLEPQ